MEKEIVLQPGQIQAIENLANILRPFRGRRLDRLMRNSRQIVHDVHTPGAYVEMSRDARYIVRPDGSYKRLNK